MAKLLAIKCSLIILQLVSLSVAAVIIIIHYNPWIKILIDVASDGGGEEEVVEQFRSIEGEEIVIFMVSLATIVVSVLGIIGAVRGQHRSHCLLNFYVTTLIIFLFITFVALCGTIWEAINKFINRDNEHDLSRQYKANNDNSRGSSISSNGTNNTSVANDDNNTFVQQQYLFASWTHLTKSFLFIIIAAAVYATSIKLTHKILDADDDHEDDDSGRHFNVNDNDDVDNVDSSNHFKNSSFTRV